jgi:hypothetical protein
MAQSKRKFITVDKLGKLGFERLAGAQSQKSRVLTISSPAVGSGPVVVQAKADHWSPIFRYRGYSCRARWRA